jgi:hypothetical protein
MLQKRQLPAGLTTKKVAMAASAVCGVLLLWGLDCWIHFSDAHLMC